jgi:hypothetical protein
MNLNKILGLIEVFVGVSGIAGGLPMILTPMGSDTETTLQILANSPFPSFLIPGIILAGIVGVGNLLGFYFSTNNLKPSAMFATVLGGTLILWIIVQLTLIGFGSWMQILYLILGAAQLILGILLMRQQKAGN